MDQRKTRTRFRRDSGSSNKQDTPVKPAQGRRDRYRNLLPHKHYEAFPEEPEAEVMTDSTVKAKSPVSTSTVHSKSVLSLSKPVFTDAPRHKATLPARLANKKSGYQVSQAGLPAIQLTAVLEDHKGGEIPGKEEEQSSAATLESTLSRTDAESTFSSDEIEDEDSTASSSLPSPESFRRENQVEMSFPTEDDPLGLHLHIKNSTLLDVSHAQSIHMHHPPNLSTILDASTILAEKSCEMRVVGSPGSFNVISPSSNNREPEPAPKIQKQSFKSDKVFQRKTPPKLTNRRSILYKKKVSFKSPIIAETFDEKRTPASKLTTCYASGGLFQLSSPSEETNPDADVSITGEVTSKKEILPLTVTLKKPVKATAEKAKFFDFATDSERDAFFQMMRERLFKLRSATLFPFTAV